MCSVWAESRFPTMDGCQHGKTLAQAEAICAAVDARLCSVDELATDCAKGTGCGHDFGLVWAVDVPPSPPSLPPPALPRLPLAVLAVAGCGEAMCVLAEAQGSVRCCSDDNGRGVSACPVDQPYGGNSRAVRVSGLPGVTGVNDATLHEAALACEAHGYRLCGVDELKSKSHACSTGCNYNDPTYLMWSEEACAPAELLLEDTKVAADSGARLFKRPAASLEECATSCYNRSECGFFAYKPDGRNNCMGGRSASGHAHHPGFNFYRLLA